MKIHYGFLRNRQLDMILKRVEETPSSSPLFPQLIKMLACNFDEFEESTLDSMMVENVLRSDQPFGNQHAFSNGRKGVSEFIGYTFKRDFSTNNESIKEPEVVKPHGPVIDPIDENDFPDRV